MRNRFFIFIFIFIFIDSLTALDKFKYEVKYLANQKLIKETKIEMDSIIKVMGDEILIKEMEKKGKKFPVFIKTLQESEEEIKTSALDDDGSINIELKNIKKDTFLLDQKNVKVKIPSAQDKLSGSTLYFNQLKDGKLELKNLDSNKMSSDEKESSFNILKQVFSATSTQSGVYNIEFKVGDSYIDTKPLSIPLNGMLINMKQNTEYKLKEITDAGIAIFDLLATYDMNMDMSELNSNLKADAYGNGILYYDISNKLEKKNEFSMYLNIEIDIQGIKMLMKSTLMTSVNIKSL